MKTTLNLTVVMPDGTELDDVEVSVDYDAYYQPAYVSGPPEDCYPAEGELTINKIDVGDCEDGDGNVVNSVDVLITLESNYQDTIEELCWEDYHASKSDDYDEGEE